VITRSYPGFVYLILKRFPLRVITRTRCARYFSSYNPRRLHFSKG
jgi:hypothetical protein